MIIVNEMVLVSYIRIYPFFVIKLNKSDNRHTHRQFTIIEFWLGLLVEMMTLRGIGRPRSQIEIRRL